MSNLYRVEYHCGDLTDKERPLTNYILADNYKEASDKIFNKVKTQEIISNIKCIDYDVRILN